MRGIGLFLAMGIQCQVFEIDTVFSRAEWWRNVEEPEVFRQEERKIGQVQNREYSSGEIWGVIVPATLWRRFWEQV